jgi:hypothetical protein
MMMSIMMMMMQHRCRCSLIDVHIAEMMKKTAQRRR